ncbi:bifunctional diaminohydroxyphosphoribosylaminopyrimidine deaminase/5-amino-6-(5-phosphoribosylamino)uracil reductase RibD [Candidatus Micrarchaeota archaeon]|nr:bifunctional diaminohydroxyphosphoribosylaminopyrimidine deaminase/5-amino-6-(5-phosphoribosylamino)uracil reductase RibD [Candidatus Micrarchaeota archaeon]
MSDLSFMSRALELAALAGNGPSPNPKVGCVIVKDGTVIAEGFHKKFGGPHAEAEALAKAGTAAEGATVYVTLEPCVHHHPKKKTPPCVPALVNAGVSRVVIAASDPNRKVHGRGVKALRSAGITVEEGIMAKQAEKLNLGVRKWVLENKPFVILKMASTADYKITMPVSRAKPRGIPRRRARQTPLGQAQPEETETAQRRNSRKKWITNRQARKKVHELRAQVDAILVGANTVVADNPRLTCRTKCAKQPLRVVLDSKLRSPLTSKIFKDSHALVFTTNKADAGKRKALQKKGVQVVALKTVTLGRVLSELARRNVAYLLVEGGATVASSFLKEGLVDKTFLFVAPQVTKKGVELPAEMKALETSRAKISTFGDNMLFEFG